MGLRKLVRELATAPTFKIRNRILRDVFRRNVIGKFRKNHIVYRFDADAPIERLPLKVVVHFERYDTISAVPSQFWDDTGRQHQTLFDEGAQLWVGYVDSKSANFLWSKPGERQSNWFVPLSSTDLLLFGAGTLQEFRGLGLHGAVMRHVIEAERRHMYCDAKEWNITAQRNIEQSGFRRICIAPPYW